MIVLGELFRLSNQMMDTFGDTVLPSNIPPESLPGEFSKFFVSKLNRFEAALEEANPH